MATDSNYLTSLAGEMVPEVNKQIDADTKQFFTYIDGLYKNEEMRLKQGTGSVKANIDNFRTHDLRACFITNALLSGMPQSSVAAISGHKDYRSMKRYTRIKAEDLVEDVNKVKIIKLA